METARLGRRLEAIKGCCGLPGPGNLLFSCSWEDSLSVFAVPVFLWVALDWNSICCLSLEPWEADAELGL